MTNEVFIILEDFCQQIVSLLEPPKDLRESVNSKLAKIEVTSIFMIWSYRFLKFLAENWILTQKHFISILNYKRKLNSFY